MGTRERQEGEERERRQERGEERTRKADEKRRERRGERGEGRGESGLREARAEKRGRQRGWREDLVEHDLAQRICQLFVNESLNLFEGVLELACSSVFSGDATHAEEIHRRMRVTARGLPTSAAKIPSSDIDRGPRGKGRLMRVCGLRRLASPTIEGVRRAPRRGSGVATHRGQRVILPSFLA